MLSPYLAKKKFIVIVYYSLLVIAHHHGSTGCADVVGVGCMDVASLETFTATFDGDSTTTPNGNGSLISKMYCSAFLSWIGCNPFSDGTEGGTCMAWMDV